MLKAIIFDMDWVLVNSTWSIRKSFVKVFEEYGIDIQQSDKKKYLWRSLMDQFKMRKEEYNIKEDILLEEFREKALAFQLELMKEDLKPDSFVQKLIQEAKDKWIKIAVATSSSKKRAIIVLKSIWVYEHLDSFVTCEDVTKSKPNPDIFLKAAELLGIEAKDCIVIEDALNGIKAAKSAGMKSAGKFGKEHTKEEFGMAEIVFEHFSKIKLQDLEKIF